MEKGFWDDITDPGEILFWVWWLFWPITIPITVVWFIVDQVF